MQDNNLDSLPQCQNQQKLNLSEFIDDWWSFGQFLQWTRQESILSLKEPADDADGHFGKNADMRLAGIYQILPEIGIGKSHTKKR